MAAGGFRARDPFRDFYLGPQRAGDEVLVILVQHAGAQGFIQLLAQFSVFLPQLYFRRGRVGRGFV